MRDKRRHVLETQKARVRETTQCHTKPTHLSSNGTWLPRQSWKSLLPLLPSLPPLAPGAHRPPLSPIALLSWQADGSVVAGAARKSGHALGSGWSGFSWESGKSGSAWWTMDQQAFLSARVANHRLALKIEIEKIIFR